MDNTEHTDQCCGVSLAIFLISEDDDTDFSFVSMSLRASAMVYGVRVDSVQQRLVRFAQVFAEEQKRRGARKSGAEVGSSRSIL